jgi:hypothetical protein
MKYFSPDETVRRTTDSAFFAEFNPLKSGVFYQKLPENNAVKRTNILLTAYFAMSFY